MFEYWYTVVGVRLLEVRMAYSCLFLKPSIAYSKEAHQLQPKLPAVKFTRLMLPAPALSYSFQDDRSQSLQFRGVQNYGSLKNLSPRFREPFGNFSRATGIGTGMCFCVLVSCQGFSIGIVTETSLVKIAGAQPRCFITGCSMQEQLQTFSFKLR